MPADTGKTKIFSIYFKGQVIIMAKFDGVIGQQVLSVTEKDNELTVVLQDNRYLFVRVNNGKLEVQSVPE